MSSPEPSDDLGFFRALAVVGPIALVLWALVIWAVLSWLV